MKRAVILVVLIGVIVLGMTAFAQDTGGGVYIVEIGDTLETIGEELDISVMALLLANDITRATILYPGDELIIPADAPAYGFAPIVVISGEGSGSRYVVQSGDVLDLIAAYFDVDLACLVEANAIENPNLIQPGLGLLIPEDCPGYRGLSTPRPEQIRGLNLRAANDGDALVLPTRRPTATPTTPPTTAPTNTPLPPTATFTPSPTVPPSSTPVPPTRPPTITPTAVG